MLLKIKPRFKMFDDYFSEADDEETQDVTTTNKIVVKPHKRRGNDYTAMEPEPEDDTPADDATDYTDTSGATNDTEADRASNEPEDDTPADDATDYTDTSGATNDDSENDEQSDQDSSDDNTDDGEGNDDAAVLSDDSDEGTDYTDTDNAGGDEESDGSSEDQGEDNTEDQNKNESEAYKKFYLFRKFSSLYNHVNSYCKTLQSSSYDNVYYSTVIKAVIDRLSEVSKCINEYLMMKFDDVSYVEGCIYYETVFNIVKLSIEMLKNNSEKAKQLSK